MKQPHTQTQETIPSCQSGKVTIKTCISNSNLHERTVPIKQFESMLSICKTTFFSDRETDQNPKFVPTLVLISLTFKAGSALSQCS